MVGQAFNFTGTYARVPNNSTLASLSALSLEAWVWLNRTDLPEERFLTISPDNVILASINGRFTFSLALAPNDASALHLISSTDAVAAHQWYHLAATYDGNVQTLYFNGKPAATAPAGPPIVPIGQAGPEFFMSFPGDQALDGMIDEAAIYNRALSAGEAQQHYAAGQAGMCKQPTLSSIAVYFSGTAFMSVKGPPTSTALQIEASTNLLQWSPLTTIDNFKGHASISDTGAGAFNKRFYRARLQ
jgi:hypothetical protein